MPTTTSKTYTPESMALAIADFRSAWEQDRGNPYYGPDSSIEAIYAVQVAARAIEWKKLANLGNQLMPPAPVVNYSAIKAEVKAAAIAAIQAL